MGKIAYMGQDYFGSVPSETYTQKSDIAVIETTSTASQNYAVGEYLYYNNQLYKVTTAITEGDTLVVDTNIEATTVGGELAQINSDLSVIGEVITSSESTSQSIATETVTAVASVELTAGSWILSGIVSFPTNANGYRAITISSGAPVAWQVIRYGESTPAVSGQYTTMRLSIPVQVNSDTTYYLYAYHNAGSTLSSSYVELSAMRISN